jgi:hypothetical protein
MKLGARTIPEQNNILKNFRYVDLSLANSVSGAARSVRRGEFKTG